MSDRAQEGGDLGRGSSGAGSDFRSMRERARAGAFSGSGSLCSCGCGSYGGDCGVRSAGARGNPVRDCAREALRSDRTASIVTPAPYPTGTRGEPGQPA